MTGTKILAAATVGSIILIAAGATFREAHSVAPQPSPALSTSPGPSTGSDFDERWSSVKKGDRLPLSTLAPLEVAAAPPELAPPVAAPAEQLPLATEDDLRQADAEHHRHRDICPHGRSYFTIEHHQYWRCKL